MDALPGQIEALEVRQQELFQMMSAPDFYRSDSQQIANMQAELADVEKQLELAFTRWEDLESRNG